MLFGKNDLNDADLKGSQIHVSAPVLEIVKGSYYNEPWPDSPLLFNKLSTNSLYQLRLNQASFISR